MFPGIDPRQMQQAMKKLGMKQEEIEASEVIIKCEDKDIVITNPSVQKVNMMGQESFQISGTINEREKSVEISEDDIKTVMEQANVDQESARKALKDSNGDIAEAILKLKSQ
ncbi:MAG: nascent polypeptide-associated complex protein [Candidatus Woesearchaeota archaeon]|nr:nascent polypeptide-associated complex protein [Candidatus Woesearchaeota archaeon]